MLEQASSKKLVVLFQTACHTPDLDKEREINRPVSVSFAQILSHLTTPSEGKFE